MFCNSLGLNDGKILLFFPLKIKFCNFISAVVSFSLVCGLELFIEEFWMCFTVF